MSSAHKLTERKIWAKFNEIHPKGSEDMERTQNSKIFVIQQLRNLGRRFGTSGMHLGPPKAWAAVRSGAVVLLFLSFCLLLLPLCESVIALCFVVRQLSPF